MLAELPFVSAEEIAEQFRPGGTTTTKSALETLRRRGLLSEGISRPLRDKGGKTRGTLRVYSSLLRDAAAFAASGHDASAMRLVAIATRLEQRQDATRIADALARVGASIAPEQRTIALMIRSAASEPSVANQLATYAEAITRARKTAPCAWQVALGHIASMKQPMASIVLLDGAVISLPQAKLPAPPPGEGVGTPVAIRWADLGRGVWMTAEPAIDVPSAAGPVYPFERRRGEPTTIPTAVLNGAPTMRRSGRTKITG
jgi:hypothetical protein